MSALEIFNRLKNKAKIINANARIFGYDVGFTIPVQVDVTDEVLVEVDQMLTKERWSFIRTQLGHKGQCYTLFPFG